jgi:Lar family restriction alleviation protein
MTKTDTELSGEQALKPCPFCGGEPLRMEDGALLNGGRIECRHCGAQSIDSARIAFAIAAWNRRAEQPATPESVVPSELADEQRSLWWTQILIALDRAQHNCHHAAEPCNHCIAYRDARRAAAALREMPRLSDEQCDAIIDALDTIARDHDEYAYGLPVGSTTGDNDEPLQPIMRAAIRRAVGPLSAVQNEEVSK